MTTALMVRGARPVGGALHFDQNVSLLDDQARWAVSSVHDQNADIGGLRCTCPACMGVAAAAREQTVFPSGGAASNGKPIFSWDEAAAQLTRGGYTWSPTLGQGVTITYAFRSTEPGTMPDGVTGFTRFNATQIIAAEAALRLWADVANVTFVRVGTGTTGDAAYSDSATILFSDYTANTASAAGFAYLPSPGQTGFGSAAGDVWLDGTLSYNSNPVFGDYGYQVLAHEIGHTLGIRHPSEYDGGSPTYAADATWWQDSRMFTIMSYFASSSTGASLGAFAAGPQLLDIAAAQRLYGPNTNTRTGNTVYGFNSNTGLQHFSVTSSSQPAVFSIWDSGGVDTLDLSGYGTNSIIDLRAESFSSAGPGNGSTAALYNISIARGAVIENAIGGSGGDTITGNSVANVLTGNGGNDVIDGGAGDDTLIGGLGDDNYGVDSSADVVTEIANQGFDTIYASLNYTLGANIEGLTLTGSALSGFGNGVANALQGNGLNNYLNGGGGDDFLAGGAGADIIDGAVGNDIMDGGLGDDSYGVDSTFDTVRENPGEGFDAVYATFDYSLGANIEQLNLVGAAKTGYGNSLGNAIFGNELANYLNGGGGDDYLSGGAGADIIDGVSGNDIMDGGLGDDSYGVDSAFDTVRENAGEGFDAIYATFDYGLGANIEQLNLVGAAVVGYGNELGNAIFGNALANYLNGGLGGDYISGAGGSDIIDGGAGADIMDGGLGDDSYAVDSTGDVVRENAGEGFDAVYSSVSFTLGANFEQLNLQGTAISAVGNTLANAIYGNASNNTINGGAGNDVLSGGAGDDTFVFQPGAGQDRITDFVVGGTDDRIDLTAYTGSGVTYTVTQSGADAVFNFSNGDQIILVGANSANLVQSGDFWG